MSSSTSLYKLSDAMRTAIAGGYIYDEETGEIIWSPDDVEALGLAITDKAEAVLAVKREYEAMAEAAKAESKRIAEVAKGYEKKGKQLDAYLLACMRSAGLKDIETPLGRLHARPSKSCEVVDESLIPDEYMRVKVTETRTPDKAKAGKDIDAGIAVPGFARMYYDILEVK